MKHWLAGLALLAATLGLAQAAQQAFTEAEFERLQNDGAIILVDVYAEWCPTCAKQHKVLQRYREQNPDKVFHTLVVDFDDDKEWVRHFRAPRQSTLILFAGDRQVWFSVAETGYDEIARQIDKAIDQSKR